MNIAMQPNGSDNNKYIDLIQNSIKELGVTINSFEETFSNKQIFNQTEYFIVNWYESLYTNSLIKQSRNFIIKLIKLIKLKKANKKLIWVLHNKVPHDSKHVFYSKILMKWLVENSYKIIIHSKESKNVISELTNDLRIMEKVVYMPHPNYIGAYKDCNNNQKETGETLNLLFIGAIKPYKNVDLLIEVFNELNLDKVTLTLAGKVATKEYEKYITNIIGNNKNIKVDFRFIEDDEIVSLINESDMLVLPYDIKSSLNSGTIFLAFSNKKTVLSPLIGSLKDFDDKDLFFSYEYESIEEHKKRLNNNILNIYNKYKKDNSLLQEMGMKCYQIVEKENNMEKIRDIFKNEIFNDIDINLRTREGM